MKILFIVACALLSAGVFAQDASTINDPNAKPRQLNGSFTVITVSDGIDLFLTEGTSESLAVSFSDAKYEERFVTEVTDGVLKIYYNNKGINWADNSRKKLKAYVSFKTLEKLDASGGADVSLLAPINVNILAMKFTSGSGLTGKLNAKELTIEQNSGSVIDISGTAEKIKIDVSSGASFKGYDFAANYCDAKATSGAGIRISIQKELNAKANSGGGIHYKGDGVVKELNVSSGGIVKKV